MNKYVTLCVMLLLFAAPLHAETFVKVSGHVEDYEDVTPLEDVADKASFVVQAGTTVSDVTNASIFVQTLSDEGYIVGFQVDYSAPLNFAANVRPYAGAGVGLNFDDNSDKGAILTGVAGLSVGVSGGIGVYAEARSLTRFTGGTDSTVGVGAGLSLLF